MQRFQTWNLEPWLCDAALICWADEAAAEVAVVAAEGVERVSAWEAKSSRQGAG